MGLGLIGQDSGAPSKKSCPVGQDDREGQPVHEDMAISGQTNPVLVCH